MSCHHNPVPAPVAEDSHRAAYDAVYTYIHELGQAMPPTPVHRNAMIWGAVERALDAAGVRFP